jgi:hypothetical protein
VPKVRLRVEADYYVSALSYGRGSWLLPLRTGGAAATAPA